MNEEVTEVHLDVLLDFGAWSDDPLWVISQAGGLAVFLIGFSITCCLGCCISCCRTAYLCRKIQRRKKKAGEEPDDWDDNFGARRSSVSEGELDFVGTGPPSFRQPLSRLSKELVPNDGSVIYPAYKSGESVEYFSVQQGQWVVAVLKVEVIGSGKHCKAVYKATVAQTGEEDNDVTPDRLREALVPGEVCEYFSSGENKWILATIAPGRRLFGHKIVYKIHLGDGASGEVKDTPASLLRRHVPEGSWVEVYHGQNHGWVQSVATHGHHVMHVANCCDKVQMYWRMVPIVASVGHSHPEMTPSFLVRPFGLPTAEPILRLDNRVPAAGRNNDVYLDVQEDSDADSDGSEVSILTI